MRGILTASLMGGLGIMGFWLGEDGGYAWDLALLGAGGLGALAVAGLAPVKAASKAALGLSSLALLFAAWFAGAQSFARAYNECVEKGEDVRALLRAYYGETHEYPDTLETLRTSMPCRRVLRASLLAYERTASGYRLSFADRLVAHTATESEPFLSHK